MRRFRGRGDEGTTLVEAVFIFPVVFFIVMAIFEYGFLFAAQSTTQSSTREAARFASANLAVAADKKVAADLVRDVVVQDLGARTGYDLPLNLLIYKADTNGNPTGGFSSCTASCFHYTWNGSTFVYDNNTAIQWTDPQACISQTLDSVGVYVELRHNYITGAFGSTADLKEHTVSRLEPLPLTQCP